MENLPLVSINIPVYKVEKYIERCLNSVIKQTYRNIEIILVDDVSPDKSMEVAQLFFEKNPSFKVKYIYHEENSGLSVGRNNGIINSEGKYIYMLDSDDYITEDCIEKLVKKAEEKNAEITVAETICYDSTEQKEKLLFPIKTNEKTIEGNARIFKEFVNGSWPIIAPNKLYRRDFIEKNNLRFVKGLYSQDELWAFHCALVLNKIAFIKDVTYIYFLHGASTIYNKKKINFENHQTIVEHFTETYHKITDKTRRQLIKRKLIGFKDTTLVMQYKSMRDDEQYWKQNYTRLKKAPSLSLSDYFSNDFTQEQKKKNFFLNLPTELGFKIFKKRFGK